MEKGSIVKGVVENLAFGGAGIIRCEGLVIFVPYAAPGDTLTCRIVEKKQSYAKGEIISIDIPTIERVSPPCPYFGECGGCQLQHISYPEQIDQKQKWVNDAFQRIAHLPLDTPPKIHPAHVQWAYRRHVNLTLRASEKGFQMGYIGKDNKTLIPVNSCVIFEKKSHPLFVQVRQLIGRLESSKNEGRVALIKQEEEFVLHFHFKFMPPNAKEIFEGAMRTIHSCRGVHVSTSQGQMSFGDISCSMDLEGLNLNFAPGMFVQNHPEQSLAIYQHVVDNVVKRTRGNVLDLYCGIGCMSLLLAKRVSYVTGIESNKEAIRFAKANATANQIDNAEFFVGKVEELLDERWKKMKPDFVIVNPPREGLDGRVIESLKNFRPQGIAYVSCMPSTLARDVNLLGKGGYSVESCETFDMFPQTTHVETVVFLRKIFEA